MPAPTDGIEGSALPAASGVTADDLHIIVNDPAGTPVLQRATHTQLLAYISTALGSTFQPLNSDLTAIAALTTTAFGRALLELADAAAGRTALGLGTAATAAAADFALLASANTFTLGPNAFRAGADGNVALIARRHSSGATGDIFQIQDENGTVLGYINVSGGALLKGHSAIGGGAAIDADTALVTGLNYRSLLILSEELTASGALQRSALTAHVKINPAGSSSGSSFAIDAEVETTAGNIQTHSASLIAIFGHAKHKNAVAITNIRGLHYFASNEGGATVTSVQGIFIEAQNRSSGVATTLAGLDLALYNSTGAVTTNAYGVRIQAPINSATITNNYGIHIANITGGATLNYAIYTAGGEVRHLAGAAGVVPLALQLAASPTADAFRILASDGTTKLTYFDSVGDLFLPTKTANTFFRGPTSGGAARPTWGALVAADIPSVSTGITGVLPVANGGTGVSALSQALTDGASIAWNVSLGAFGTVTLGGNRTMAAPSNLVAGSSYALKVTQDGTGSRTLAYNAVFKWSGGAPVLSTSAGAVDILTFISDGTNMYGSILKGFA